MNRTVAIAGALAALLATTGCQSLFGSPRVAESPTAPREAVFGAADLEQGRALLRENQPGNALRALHRASLNPATSTEALNALGVAYVRIGRGDLAERYFLKAIEQDGANETFAANLAQFYQDKFVSEAVLQAKRDEAEARQLAAAAPPPAIASAADERTVTSGGRTHRITLSGGSASTRVRLAAPESTPATLAAPSRVRIGAAPRPASASPTNGAQLRVRLVASAPGQSPRAGQPLRVRLKPAVPASVRVAAAYPLRVRLGGSAGAPPARPD